MIRNVVSSMSVAATVLSALVISAPVVHAVSTEYVESVGGEVPYGACEQFAYEWAASDESGIAYEWEASATLYQPDGELSDSDETWGSGGHGALPPDLGHGCV